MAFCWQNGVSREPEYEGLTCCLLPSAYVFMDFGLSDEMLNRGPM